MKPFLHILAIICLEFTCQSAIAGQAMIDDSRQLYAINLASSRRFFTADDLLHRNILRSLRVYTTSFTSDGKTWIRLRVGFFENMNAAITALEGIRAYYPDAWIAKVSEDEIRESSGSIIRVNTPGEIDRQQGIYQPVFNDSKSDGTGEKPDVSASDQGDSKPHASAETGDQLPVTIRSSSARRLALAGAEYGGDNAYFYAGLLVPFPGSVPGNGFVQRYWLDWLRYEYDGWNRTIKARAPGASIAVGYGKAVETGAWSLYVGPVWRNTDLSPDDPESDVRGAQWGVNISMQGDRRITDGWRVNGIASFTTGTDSYWTRGRLTRKLESGHAAGVELVFHGNADYSAWQTGLVLQDLNLVPQTLLALKGGARKTSGEDVGAYVGIELTRTY